MLNAGEKRNLFEPTFHIRFTFANSANSRLFTIGLVTYTSLEERMWAWKSIAELPNEDGSDFSAELRTQDGSDFLYRKCVSAKTCEAFLHDSIDLLIARTNAVRPAAQEG